MKKLFFAILLLLVSQTCVFGSWWDGQYLLGDWAGQRQKLSDKGIDFTGTYVTDLLGNVSGGEDGRRFRYDSSTGLDVNFDMEKLCGLAGLQSHASGVYRQGDNLSDDIGNRFPPSSIYGSEEIRLYNLYLEQAMLDDKVSR